MTVIMPLGRSISQHLLSRSQHVLTRLSTPTTLLRVSYNVHGNTGSRSGPTATDQKPARLVFVRRYATAKTAKPAGRPKAHTGRSTAKKTTSTRSQKGTKVPKKIKKKAVKKPKVKAKAKPKRKAPSATAIKAKARADLKELKTTALFSEPKKLPENAWAVYFADNKIQKASKFSDSAEHTRQVATDYRSLSPLERERLNHAANENKSTNKDKYEKWLSGFTPLQIKQANTARKQLAAQKKNAGKARKSVPLIKDDRLVKHPRTAYNMYHSERYNSGDFKNMALKEASILIGKEWKSLSNSDKQRYHDEGKQNQLRYIEEYKSVYGVAPPSAKTKKTT